MPEWLQSIVTFVGALFQGSGKKRKVKTIDASGSVWDKDKETPAEDSD